MSRKICVLLLSAIGLASLWAAPPVTSLSPLSTPIVFTDALGRPRRFEAAAARVVSLSPALTEILFAVGAGDAVVGVTEYCDYPAETATKTKVGGFSGKTISIESIVALEPGLVLLSAEMHQKVADLLESVGVRTVAVEPVSFAGLLDAIRLIGGLTGCSTEAAALSASLRARLAAVNRAVAGRSTPTAFWELWDDPLMTAGGGSFVSEALSLAGGRNLFADRGENWPTVSFEELLARQPDWLLSGDDHGDRFDIKLLSRRPQWNALVAVKAGRIATVESDTVYRAGPRLVEGVEALARILHPDAFPVETIKP